MNIKIEQNPERIMEIIVHVISELRNARSMEEIDMDALQRRGYTEAEISVAVSWLVQRMEEVSGNAETQPDVFAQPLRTSFRTFHQAELHLFTKEALGELVQLQTLGIITAEHIESIVERSFMFGEGNVGKAELYAIISELIFREFPSQAGSRTMLTASDTIH